MPSTLFTIFSRATLAQALFAVYGYLARGTRGLYEFEKKERVLPYLVRKPNVLGAAGFLLFRVIFPPTK
jgi:hypothetical protein